MSIRVHEAVCTGCASCVLSCPEDAVSGSPSFIARIDADVCTDCLVCLDSCPTDALTEE